MKLLFLVLVGAGVVGVTAFASRGYFSSQKNTPQNTIAVEASQEPSTYTLAVTNPHVFLKNKPEKKKEEVKGSTLVSAGAHINTSADGRGSVLYPNGTISAIDTDSELIIADVSNQGKSSSLELVSGGVFSKIKNVLGVGDSYKVKTANVVASVRGTMFATQHKKQTTTIFGIQHKVGIIVLDKKGNPIPGPEVQVASGFKAIVPGINSAISVVPMTDEDFDNPLVSYYLLNLLDKTDRKDPEIILLLNRLKARSTITPTPTISAKPTPTPSPTPTATPRPTLPPTQFQNSTTTATPTPSPTPSTTLESVVPNSVTAGTDFTINGTNFMTGRNVKQITNVLLNTTSVAFSIIDPQTIFATAQVRPGVYDVSIVTINGQQLTLKAALTVK